MKRFLTGAGLFAALILLFLVANRGAYQGYFQDDELDNISWTRAVPLSGFLSGLAQPKLFVENFRPAGHLYFNLMERWAGLRFPPYVASIHALHFLNVLLLWFVLRGLKLSAVAAGAGALFFAFHMAVFDAYWKPMYVFDVLCATFSLAALLAWMHRRWVVSLAAFWLAYKSKELAVMLPLVLALYQFWLGEKTDRRRWLSLSPFFAVSLLYGVQALLMRPETGNAYRMDFSLATLAKTVPFYSAQAFLIPFAGLALLALPFLVRDRRAWFGISASVLFLAPLLFLPGRLFAAYIYLPLVGVAAALSTLAWRAPRWAVALFFLIWLPWNYHHMRLKRRAALTIAQENRAYVGELLKAAAGLPDTRLFLYDGAPPSMARWGVEGTLRYFYREQVTVLSIDDAGLAESTRGKDIALLSWDPAQRRLAHITRPASQPPAAYIRMDSATPVWQLLEGWLPRSGHFRWTRPMARAILTRPAGARRFEVVVNAGPPYIAAVKRGELEVLLDGQLIGRSEFTREGWQTVGFDLALAPAGQVEVQLRASPEIREPPNNPSVLGIPIGAFGFVVPADQ